MNESLLRLLFAVDTGESLDGQSLLARSLTRSLSLSFSLFSLSLSLLSFFFLSSGKTRTHRFVQAAARTGDVGVAL